nr:uncharacterized protein LOC123747314 isoform X1 [Procambarus clarkii]
MPVPLPEWLTLRPSINQSVSLRMYGYGTWPANAAYKTGVPDAGPGGLKPVTTCTRAIVGVLSLSRILATLGLPLAGQLIMCAARSHRHYRSTGKDQRKKNHNLQQQHSLPISTFANIPTVASMHISVPALIPTSVTSLPLPKPTTVPIFSPTPMPIHTPMPKPPTVPIVTLTSNHTVKPKPTTVPIVTLKSNHTVKAKTSSVSIVSPKNTSVPIVTLMPTSIHIPKCTSVPIITHMPTSIHNAKCTSAPNVTPTSIHKSTFKCKPTSVPNDTPTHTSTLQPKPTPVPLVMPMPAAAPQLLSTRIPKNVVRFVCISDTHNKTDILPFPIPDGDVLLHGGDFTIKGKLHEALVFNDWLGHLPHKHKVVIAGNHDRLFDKNFKQFTADSRKVFTNAIYLQDQHTSIYGIKIYGAPWTPEYHNLAFNLPRGQPCLEKWSLIPKDTDILMTHGPPWGQRDFTKGKQHVGCEDLLAVVQNKVMPKYHVFGHIHEGYGMTKTGRTVFVNAAMCNIHYKPINPPIVFDLPLPRGYTKN